MRICRHCVYFRPYLRGDFGECKRYPYILEHPATDWCGEHTAKGEDKKGFWREPTTDEKDKQP